MEYVERDERSIVKSKRARTVLMIVALALLMAAVVWGTFLNGDDELKLLADRINEYGYELTRDDIYIVGETRDTSISDILAGQELDECVAASKAAGFPSDVNAVGDVVLMLVELDNYDVITVYLRDADIELCFVQNITSGEVSPLGGAK